MHKFGANSSDGTGIVDIKCSASLAGSMKQGSRLQNRGPIEISEHEKLQLLSRRGINMKSAMTRSGLFVLASNEDTPLM